MMDGRVKTLHPKVHGGLLAIRDNPEHAASMQAHGIAPIDLVVVNLYPFEATVAKGAGYEDCIENIDIGGPAMIRAAAKNHDDVAVMRRCRRLRAAAGRAESDMAADHASRCASASPPRPMRARRPMMLRSPTGSPQQLGDDAPTFRAIGGKLVRSAALWREPAPDGGLLPHAGGALRRRHRAAGAGQGTVLQQHQRHRRRVRMRRRVRSERTPAVAIVKHANPCGVAEGASLLEAYRKALACDPTSAFGGIVALNRTLDARSGEGHHRDLHRGDHRAGCRATKPSPSSAARRTCACC